MKKILLIALSLLAVFSFTACGLNSNLVTNNGDTTANASEKTTEQSTTEKTTNYTLK